MELKKRPLNKDKPVNKNSWFHNKWRPAMAWSYLIICMFDFFIAPIGMAVLKSIFSQAFNSSIFPWEPLTLKGGGLYHMAMLTIVGATAWGRTQEKIKRLASFTRPPSL